MTKDEINARFQSLYDAGMASGEHGFYETVFRSMHGAYAPVLDMATDRIEALEAALRAEDAADAAFDAADEYTHRADAEGWLNDPTGSMHVNEAWDRANGLRAKAKELRATALQGEQQ